jgi:hypothetical protein
MYEQGEILLPHMATLALDVGPGGDVDSTFPFFSTGCLQLISSGDASLGGLFHCLGEPGRGGTCQISPWDHVFLGAFWAYNTGSVHTFRWC